MKFEATPVCCLCDGEVFKYGGHYYYYNATEACGISMESKYICYPAPNVIVEAVIG